MIIYSTSKGCVHKPHTSLHVASINFVSHTKNINDDRILLLEIIDTKLSEGGCGDLCTLPTNFALQLTSH